ncbi:hypothetical protein PCC8801_2481 [Rippkaea orientalis PCC 8801]|uniref:Uncharacterized protein n=1 Tax=Rippkaea orientalis (strain PCC 8801 / RF-1) TaxID=41431 RepID=B7K3V0_RIPO1|nr:hypothetical protein [Rippkaea orientalis]ACK66490.1 hypothetical protein PCC8801_2481 [Rippkaea orientalis PCC 8801]
MSSSSSSPYKSRLFNFLNRQSLQLRDRLHRTTRHLKLAATWGIQLVLYPVYVVVQAGRTARKRLGQATTIADNSTVFLESDRPINRILQEIDPLLLTTEEENDHQITPKLTFQGIANLLENRHLVLVSKDNQTLDLLSFSQQKTLENHIRLETANYYYENRLKYHQTRITPGLISSFSNASNNVLPPIRLFWQTMRWVQTSPVAIKLNLFEESSLGVSPQEIEMINVDFESSLQDIKMLIQQTINDLDKTETKKALTSQESALQVLPYSVNLRELVDQIPLESLVKPVKEWGDKLEKQAKESLQDQTGNPFAIKMLIFAAIDYFFGQTSVNTKLQQSSSSNYSLPSQKLAYKPLDDPWLSWDDLYQELSAKSPHPSVSLSPPALLQSSNLPPKPRKSEKKRLKRQLKRQNEPKAIKKRQTVHHEIVTEEKIERSVSNVSLSSTSLNKLEHQDNSPDILPDWIETKAKSTGYVKHPLVHILEWLDRIILWVEEWVVKCWNWLQKLLK